LTKTQLQKMLRRLEQAERRNPAKKKLRRVTGSTGWIEASAVRFVKKAGKAVEVYLRKKPRKRRAAKHAKKGSRRR
jgi:hypothetical protein